MKEINLNIIKKFNWKTLILCILIAGISFVFGYFIKPCKTEIKRTEIETLKLDTIWQYLPQKTIYVKQKAQIEYQTTKDTVKIVTEPFTASIDTVLNQDTISAKYYFPNNDFEIRLRMKPDSIYTKIQYETILKEIEKPKFWYDYTLQYLGYATTIFLLIKDAAK